MVTLVGDNVSSKRKFTKFVVNSILSRRPAQRSSFFFYEIEITFFQNEIPHRLAVTEGGE
jgi:hypothetical protein